MRPRPMRVGCKKGWSAGTDGDGGRVRNALRSASTNVAFRFTLKPHLTWPNEPRLKQCMPSILDPIPWIFAYRKTGDMEKLWISNDPILEMDMFNV